MAAHWRRSGFAAWLFYPAAMGWYSRRDQQEAYPVPLVAEPWPGAPARGRGAWEEALDARRAMSPGSPVAALDAPC